MITLHRFVLFVLRSATVLALLAATSTARAETIWVCWYNGDTAVHCVLRQPDVSSVTQSEVQALPVMAKVLRTAPEKLAGERVSIPLYTNPDDMHFVRELSESVMCGSNRNCRVDYADSLAHVALLIDAFDDALN